MSMRKKLRDKVIEKLGRESLGSIGQVSMNMNVAQLERIADDLVLLFLSCEVSDETKTIVEKCRQIALCCDDMGHMKYKRRSNLFLFFNRFTGTWQEIQKVIPEIINDLCDRLVSLDKNQS